MSYPKSNIEYVQNISTLRLNNASQSFSECVNLPGDFVLRSVMFSFSSDRVNLKLSIDGDTVFDFDWQQMNDSFSASNSPWSLSGIASDVRANTLTFAPKVPILVVSSLVLEARANNNSNGRDFLGYILERGF